MPQKPQEARQALRKLVGDPNDSWAQVELYRWQHGELPPQDDTCKALSVPAGLRGMATAIEKRDYGDFRSAASDVASVLF